MQTARLLFLWTQLSTAGDALEKEIEKACRHYLIELSLSQANNDDTLNQSICLIMAYGLAHAWSPIISRCCSNFVSEQYADHLLKCVDNGQIR
jgi:hypothetical protein